MEHRTLNSEKGMALVVAIMMMAIMLSITGAGLLFSGIDLKISGNLRSGTQAFYAAETGVNIGINQLMVNQAAATAPFAGTMDEGFAYRSGRRDDSGSQPLEFSGMRTAAGYSIGTGTGYNPSGYGFYTYEINVTGTGPMGTAREIEALAQYGPVGR